jgi:hypothetical protein
MPSQAQATATSPRGGDGGAAGRTDDDHLWAKAAELERDFAGYKRRLAERRAHAAAAAEVVAGGRAEEERRGGEDDAAAAGRGRRYEEYVRKRDERLRQEWRARMERKEAEMQAFWARLDRAGSRGRRACGELAAATASISNAGEVTHRDAGSPSPTPTLWLPCLQLQLTLINCFPPNKPPFSLHFLWRFFLSQTIDFHFSILIFHVLVQKRLEIVRCRKKLLDVICFLHLWTTMQ